MKASCQKLLLFGIEVEASNADATIQINAHHHINYCAANVNSLGNCPTVAAFLRSFTPCQNLHIMTTTSYAQHACGTWSALNTIRSGEWACNIAYRWQNVNCHMQFHDFLKASRYISYGWSVVTLYILLSMLHALSPPGPMTTLLQISVVTGQELKSTVK